MVLDVTQPTEMWHNILVQNVRRNYVGHYFVIPFVIWPFWFVIFPRLIRCHRRQLSQYLPQPDRILSIVLQNQAMDKRRIRAVAVGGGQRYRVGLALLVLVVISLSLVSSCSSCLFRLRSYVLPRLLAILTSRHSFLTCIPFTLTQRTP